MVLPGGALLLFEGKMTGFRDAGGSPSVFFNPGDCIGLEHLEFSACMVEWKMEKQLKKTSSRIFVGGLDL